MNKIDPRLFAVGTGAVAGANFMAIDNDPLALAAGVGIGAGTGMLLDLSSPDNLDGRANKAINNVRLSVDPSSSTGSAQTFSEMKNSVLNTASRLAKNSKSTATSFDTASPFGSLNKNTFEDFSRYLTNLESESSLKELQLALQLKDDSVFTHTSQVSDTLTTDVNRVQKIKEGSNLKSKMNALTSELKKMGFSGDALDKKLLMFEPLLKNHSGNINISDGAIDLRGVGKIQITKEIGQGSEKALVYANNRNMYDVKRVNIFGAGLAGNDAVGKDSIAIAKALGITMGDLFNLNAQFNSVQGMAPDEAIAMMAHSGKLNETQMGDFIKAMNTNYNYNENMSGEYKKHLAGKGPAITTPSSHSLLASNTVDYKTTLNFNDMYDTLDEKSPFRDLQQVSNNGVEKSELKRLQENMTKLSNGVFYGSSADHGTQLPVTGSVTNKVFSINSAMERNVGTVYNRDIVSTLDTPLNRTAKMLLETYGAKHQYASAVALQMFSVNSDLEIPAVHEKQRQTISNLIATAFGSDRSTGDGYALANRKITNRITSTGTTSATFTQTAKGNYIALNEAMRQHIQGNLSLDDMRTQALTGSTKLSKKVESSLTRAKTIIEGIQAAKASKSEEDMFNVLKQNNRSFSKYSSYADYLQANKKFAGVKDKLGQLEKIATKTVLSKDLSQASIFSKKIKDASHFAVVDEMNKVNKQVVKLQAAMTSKNFSDATSVIDALLTHNELAKTHTASFEAYFPKPGSTIGYGKDMTPIEVKQNYRYLEFDGLIRSINQSPDDVVESIQAMYKGTNKAGQEDISKSYGTASKNQLRHLDSDEFGRVGFVQSLAKEGRLSFDDKGMLSLRLANSKKPVKISASQLNAENFEDVLIKGGASKADIAYTRKSISFFTNNIGTIAEDGGSGMKNAEAILSSLKALNKQSSSADMEADVRSRIGSSTMADSLINRVKASSLTENQLKGLSNMAISLSGDRASSDYLLTTLTSMRESYSLKVSNYTNALGTAQEANQLKALQSFAVDMTGDSSFGSGPIDVNKLGASMLTQEQNLMRYNQDASALFELYKDPKKLDALGNLFMAERTYRDASIGDSLISMSAFNRRVEAETGAGSEGKSMSWNSQTQLKMNGLTDKELDFFGKFNTKNVADLKAVMSIRLEGTETVNSQINDTNQKGFQAALREGVGKRRDALERAGIKINDDHGVFKLSTPNKLGFKNVPIMLEDTSLFGSYTDKSGSTVDRQLNTTISRIIDADLKLQDKDMLSTRRQALTAMYEADIEHMANTLKTSLGGQDNIMKTALAREGTNSRYSTMVPVDGQLNTKAKAGESVVSVSSEGLVKRFKQMGYDYKNLSDIEAGGHLKREGSLFKVMMEKDMPMFGIMNREPATGPGSARFVEYYLDKTLEDNGKSIHVGRQDKLYQYFQFGDFDLDHSLEYLPDYKSSKYDADAFKTMLAKGQDMNRSLHNSLEYAQLLGVKGSNKDKVGSLLELLDQNPNKYKNVTEWYEDYINEVLITKQKAGDRKTISPTVTKIAADINNAIAGSDGDQAVATRARVLSHYFVENLLKSQHISNDKYKANPVSMAEQLAKHLYNKNDPSRSKFNEEFANYIDNTIIKNIKSSGMTAEAQEALVRETNEATKLIQDSIRHYDPEAGPKNPMEWSKTRRAEKVSSSIDDLIKSIIGKSANVQLLGVSEEFIQEGNSLSLAQRGKLGYHKALEVLKHNIGNNKKLLATAAGMTVGAALLTQKKPNFGESRAEANPGGMLMAPSQSMLEDTAAQQGSQGSLNRAVEYIRPYKTSSSGFTSIDASPISSSGNLNNDIDNFIFGDGLSSARVINSFQS